MLRQDRIQSLSHWLAAGAPGPDAFGHVIAEIAKRIGSAGMPLELFGVYKTMMHPELPGRLDLWTAASGLKVYDGDQVMMTRNDLWIGTPAEVCMRTGRTVVYSPGTDPEFDAKQLMQNLRSRGFTQVAYLPLHSRYTPAISVVAFGVKRPGGFTADEHDAMRRLQAPISRVTEGFILNESTVAVLSTYVGRDAGQKVLTGNIRRGGTETIPAIVLFVDVKGFTDLSNQLPPPRIIDALNRFFSELDDAVSAQGGEILKLIGDGALCIFPTPDDFAAQAAAAISALAALEDMHAALACVADWPAAGFRAALHLGDVHYGNIGSPRRLDFTVIGPAVNFASRLLQVASEADEDTVCSAPFAALLDRPFRPLGAHRLKGFAEPAEVFAADLAEPSLDAR